MYEDPEKLLLPYVSILSEFGRKNRYEQDVCRHDMPMWRFLFPLPTGGRGHVDVQVNKTGDVFIVKYWPKLRFSDIANSTESLKIEDPLVTLEQSLVAAVEDIRNSVRED